MAVSAKEILAEAEALRETMISDRRTLHAAPEAGADLPRTREYVAGRLREMGYEPKELAGGITAEITGSDTGTCVLLRADMDARASPSRPTCPFARRTAVCTPAATICTQRCCSVRQSCCAGIRAS